MGVEMNELFGVVCFSCKGSVIARKRTVLSEPEEQNWPRDYRVKVPFCPTCKVILGVDELLSQPPSTQEGS